MTPLANRPTARLLFVVTLLAPFAVGCDMDESIQTGRATPLPDSGTGNDPNRPVPDGGGGTPSAVDPAFASAARMIRDGRETFRFDTFGDEAFWGGVLKLHDVIQGEALGGVGQGIGPETALAVGLKVDVDRLPKAIRTQFENGELDLVSPVTTLALLRLNAVVGVTGFFDDGGKGETLESIGIQCAVCHSTVDDSFAPGIGHRRDGWANRDLNVGAIVNLSRDLSAVATLLGVSEDALRSVLLAWGPGKFDAEVFLDGKHTRPDGKSGATLIPPAFGMAGVNMHTWTGWGSVTYWNAFVANLEMHGQGTFYDPRLDDAEKFPIAAANGFGHLKQEPEMDRITPKLADLHFYQMSLEAPTPPVGSYDVEAAARGANVFNGPGECASCHVPPLFTEPGWNMHTADEIGIDNFQAKRSPDEAYRTTPLKGLFSHVKGGFYHDGRFATLGEVVEHYNTHFGLGLTAAQQADLVEYLKSI